ncbi:hypothetical protein MRX96_056030 [Rhipicephalus microplus]
MGLLQVPAGGPHRKGLREGACTKPGPSTASQRKHPMCHPSLHTVDDMLFSTISTGINLEKYDVILVKVRDPQFLRSFTSFEELRLWNLLAWRTCGTPRISNRRPYKSTPSTVPRPAGT